ncbi:MAG: aldo/keto reductase [bacterium]
MQYRNFGKTDFKPSALGFGAMRLPVKDGKIDDAEATRMVRHAIDRGVNYVDTAWVYHQGESESFLGRALADGYREQVKLATKMPCWKIERPEQLDEIFDQQLRNLRTDRIDCYLFHSLFDSTWRKMKEIGALEWAERKVAQGQIGYLGFSFHDELPVLKTILDDYDKWVFCQLQYNYMDVRTQAGTEGVRLAAQKGLAVIVMEPLLGGRLASPPPPAVTRLWDSLPTRRSPADWALQWVWNQPEVSFLLSGMSTFDQVEQNLDSANRSAVGNLSAGELAVIDRVRVAFSSLVPVPCTKCGYCQPCPHGVQIPDILDLYNLSVTYNNVEASRSSYDWIRDEHRAHQCVACGQCEERCPQKIRIMDWLKKADKVLK